MIRLGKRICALRDKQGWNQLARRCGWDSQSRIGNYETETREPKLADLELIAKALGVTLCDLMFGPMPGMGEEGAYAIADLQAAGFQAIPYYLLDLAADGNPSWQPLESPRSPCTPACCNNANWLRPTCVHCRPATTRWPLIWPRPTA